MQVLAHYSCDEWIESEEQLPEAGIAVLYRTDDYQRSGYLDGRGVWHSTNGEYESHPVLRWQILYPPAVY